MSWTPTPGDKVTSPLLVGEWEVVRSDAVIVWLAHSNGAAVSINREHVSPVVPPLPAEPPVGSVVWAKGRYWMRCSVLRETPWHAWGGAVWMWSGWSDIAADAEPVVAVSQVADWLDEYVHGPGGAEAHKRFGWPDE